MFLLLRPLVEYLITLYLQKRDDKNTSDSTIETCVVQCFRKSMLFCRLSTIKQS